MYTRSPSSGDSQWSSGSDAASTPSHAPRSIHYDDFPSTPRTPSTPLTPSSPGSAGYYAPFALPQHGGNHHVAYGLMTPPASPDKAGRGRPDFHPMLDARTQPLAFDVRMGMMLHPQVPVLPAINHSVNCMIVSVGGLDIKIASRTVPTLSEFMAQLVSGLREADPRRPSVSRAATLGAHCVSAGLTLRSIEHGVAFCVLHLTGPR